MKAARAKLFQNGGSQAVRLPRECRFPKGESEVVVRRVGRRVILEPVEEWPGEFLKSLGSLSGELPQAEARADHQAEGSVRLSDGALHARH